MDDENDAPITRKAAGVVKVELVFSDLDDRSRIPAGGRDAHQRRTAVREDDAAVSSQHAAGVLIPGRIGEAAEQRRRTFVQADAPELSFRSVDQRAGIVGPEWTLRAIGAW